MNAIDKRYEFNIDLWLDDPWIIKKQWPNIIVPARAKLLAPFGHEVEYEFDSKLFYDIIDGCEESAYNIFDLSWYQTAMSQPLVSKYLASITHEHTGG